MKKVINIILVTVGLTFGNAAYAAGELDLMIKENKTLVVNLDDVERGDLLFLTNKAGEILFKDSILLDEPYSKSLNMEIVPRGTYYLNLEKEDHIQTSVIEKTEQGIVIRDDFRRTFFKPCFKEEGRQVIVFLTNPGESLTRLEVKDAQGTLVANERDSKYNFIRVLDFSEVPSGDYTISIHNGDKLYERVVKF